jgi:hypothetical protein
VSLTQTLRPTGTVQTIGSVTGVGGGVTPHGSTSDNNTATGVVATADGTRVIMDITDYTIPANKRVREVQIRLQVVSDPTDVGQLETVLTAIRDVTANKVSAADALGSASAGVLVTRTGQRYVAGPGGHAFDQVEVNRMTLQIQWKKQNNPLYLQVREAFVDLTVTDRPVVSAVTVTNQALTTRPHLNMTYTGDGGQGAQTRVQWKVFTQAATLVGGFDPATASGAVWDSGVLVTSSVDADVATDLQNAVTYVAYAAAAQDWPGPEGQQWWSAWVASSAFTIAIVPPPKPTLTAVPELTLPDYRMVLRINAPVNLLTEQQSSLEDGTTTGYAALTNCSLANSAAYAEHGTKSLEMNSLAAGTMTASTNTVILVEPGKQVTVYGKCKAATVARTCRIGIRATDVGGAAIGTTTYGTAAANNTTTGTVYTATFTAPANTYRAEVDFEVQSTAAANEKHRWDTIGMWYGTATNVWSLGGYKGSISALVERSERVSDTITRGPAPGWMHPQIFSCGGLQRSTDGFYLRQVNDGLYQIPADQASPESPSQVSANMIVWNVRVGASSYVDIGAAHGVVYDGMQPYALPAVPGQTYVFTMWSKANAAFTHKYYIVFTDEFNNDIGSPVAGSANSVTTTMQEFSVSGTAPAGAVYARIEVENTNGAGAIGALVKFMMPRWTTASVPESVDNWPGQVFSFKWKAVRNLSGLTLVDGQAEIVIHDHEYPGGRPAMYRVTLLGTYNGQAIASLPSSVVSTYMAPPATTLIGDPFQPENKAMLKRDGRTEEVQIEDGTEFHPLGRDGDPVVLSDWISGYNGEMVCGFENNLELYRLKNLFPARRSLFIQWHDGGIRYIRVSDRKISYSKTGLGLFTVEYLETARP